MNFLKCSKKLLLVLALLTSFNFAFGMEQKQGDDEKKHKQGFFKSLLSLVHSSKEKISAKDIAYFDKLPDIILAEIFLKINNPKDIFTLYKVSKRFQKILKSIPLEVKLNIYTLGRELDGEGLVRWVNFFPNTTSISLDSGILTDSYIKLLALSCKNLKEIILNSNDNITDETVEFLIDNCPKLRNIQFINCQNLTGKVIDKIIDLCNKNYEESFKIDFTGCPKISYLDSIKLANACPNIKNFFINCYSLNDGQIDEIIAKIPQEDFYKIKSICFCGCDNLSNIAIKKFLTKCVFIKKLCFSESGITDDIIGFINVNFKDLENFMLNDCSKFKNLFLNFEHLKDFSLSFDNNLESLIINCSNLEILLINLLKIDTKKTTVICPNLKRLAIKDIGQKVFLDIIGNYFPKLESIFYEECSLGQDFVEKIKQKYPHIKIIKAD